MPRSEANFTDLLSAAEGGQPEAQCRLGSAFSSGILTEKDLEQAVYWWRQAVDQGLEEPIYLLAQAYEDGGHGLDADLSESFYWWLQGAKYGQGPAAALACLKVGQAYLAGVGVAKDLTQAVNWLEQAAARGCGEGQVALAKARQENKAPKS
jgi:TPR repeat protein